MSIKSFVEIINSGIEIQIPNIQRDYVQGRDTEQAKGKILKFVNSIVDCLCGTKEMHLNFVYGYCNNKFFIPIDGQQRLTTLYLLHLYVWTKAGKQQELSDKNVFDYKVRPSSNRFFKALTKNLGILTDVAFENESPIAKMGKNIEVKKFEEEKNDLSIFLNDCLIVKQKWFRKCWLNDLTVRSSIIVLYLIKESFKNKKITDYSYIYNELNKNGQDAIINFQYKEIEDINRANETYVKMNARGKQLTPFENLKAELYEFFKQNHLDDANIQKFKKHLDSEWLELILHLIQKKETIDNVDKNIEENLLKVDGIIFNFFNIILTNNMVIQKKEDNVDDELIEAFMNDSAFSKKLENIKANDYVCINEESDDAKKSCKINIFKNSILDFLNLMDFLYANLKSTYFINFYNMFDQVLVPQNDDRHYNERLLLYSIVYFIRKMQSKTGINENIKTLYLFQWLKLFKNIISHSEIDKPDKFLNAIFEINKLTLFDNLSDSVTLYATLSEMSPSSKLLQQESSFYSNYQIDDELLKSKQRIKSDSWEKAISYWEDNGIFNGQSIFLLDNNLDNITHEKYECYWEKTKEIFNSNVDRYPLIALFSCYKLINITVNAKDQPSFGYKDSHENYTWQGIFERDKTCVEKYMDVLDELIASGKNYDDFKRSKCDSFKMPDYQSQHEEFLKYVLSKDYHILDRFKQGRYYINCDSQPPFVKCELLKGSSINRDDKIDLSIAFIYLHYSEKGYNEIQTLEYEQNHVVISNAGKKIIDVSFDGTSGKYKFNNKEYQNMKDTMNAIDSYIA